MTDRTTRLDGLRIRMLDGLDLIVLRDADGDLEIIQEGETIFLSAGAVALVIRALQQLSEARPMAVVVNMPARGSDLVRQVEPEFPPDAA